MSTVQMSSPECITWLAIGLIESIVVVAFNVITVFVFVKNRNLCKRSTYLVINLTVADMLVGVCSVYDLFYNLGVRCYVWQDNISRNWLYVTYALTIWVTASSQTNITAISLERLHATLRPFRHRVIKKSVYGIIIAIVWVTTGSFSITLVILRKFGGENYYFFLLSSFHGLCFLVICVSYACIVIKVRCRAQPQHHGAGSRERKLTITLLIVTVVSLMFWLPLVTLVISGFATSTPNSLSKKVILRLENTMIILFYGNSLVNPILYTTRMSEFRSALVALFHKKPQQLNQAAVVPLNDM